MNKALTGVVVAGMMVLSGAAIASEKETIVWSGDVHFNHYSQQGVAFDKDENQKIKTLVDFENCILYLNKVKIKGTVCKGKVMTASNIVSYGTIHTVRVQVRGGFIELSTTLSADNYTSFIMGSASLK